MAMGFAAWLEAAQGVINTVSEALRELGLSSGASKEEIMAAYRQLSRKYHPDMEPDPEKKLAASIRMKRLNAAIDIFKKNGFSTNEIPSHDSDVWTNRSWRPSPPRDEPRRHSGLPAWETDERSSYFHVGSDFTNLNYCKKAIYERAMKNKYGVSWENREWPRDSLPKYSILAWDGSYFRGSFTVFCDHKTLGFAGHAMEDWNSKGSNSYKTEAVFAHGEGDRNLILIRLKGQNVADKDKTFEHESMNMNPSNDESFRRGLQRKLDELAFKWGMINDEPEAEKQGWHHPGPDVDGPTDWHTYGTSSGGAKWQSYTATSKWGEYHIDPIMPRGFRVKFANAGKNPKVRGAGLWQDVGDAKDLREAKQKAIKHHKEISK